MPILPKIPSCYQRLYIFGKLPLTSFAGWRRNSVCKTHPAMRLIWQETGFHMTLDLILNAFVTLFVTLDPPGLAAISLGLTVGMNTQQRRQVARRGVLIGTIILVSFLLIGSTLLGALGITMDAFRVAGGLLLFSIAFEMVFEKRQERHEKSATRAITRDDIQNVAVFPLAIPLIAGPGAISATILLASEFSAPIERIVLIGILLSVTLMLFIALLLADKVNTLIGDTGRVIITRLLGILLAALSVQYIADGVKGLAAG
jgi:multiple antibiotic resistance protein